MCVVVFFSVAIAFLEVLIFNSLKSFPLLVVRKLLQRFKTWASNVQLLLPSLSGVPKCPPCLWLWPCLSSVWAHSSGGCAINPPADEGKKDTTCSLLGRLSICLSIFLSHIAFSSSSFLILRVYSFTDRLQDMLTLDLVISSLRASLHVAFTSSALFCLKWHWLLINSLQFTAERGLRPLAYFKHLVQAPFSIKGRLIAHACTFPF